MSAEQLSAFEDWVAADPDNRRDAERLFDAWEEAESLRGEPGLEALLAEVQPRRVNQSFGAVVAVACGLLVVVGLWSQRSDTVRPVPEQFEVAVGHQSSVELQDGSNLLLNSGAAVNLPREFSSSRARHVELDRGEVLFDVARDEARPFVVDAGSARVRVLGTVFAVERSGDCVSVGVLEGRVEVEMNGAPPVVLNAGETEVCEGSSTPSNYLARVEAWREGRLEFEDTPLGEAILEFNRYSKDLWVLEDESLEDLRLSGSYFIDSVADSESLAFALRTSLGLEAVLEDGRVVLRESVSRDSHALD